MNFRQAKLNHESGTDELPSAPNVIDDTVTLASHSYASNQPGQLQVYWPYIQRMFSDIWFTLV